ncbi:hypothetical protein D3C76_1299050 [compost metagenome]
MTIHHFGAFRSNAEAAFLAAGVGNDQLLVNVVPSDRTFYERSENAGRDVYFIAALNDIDKFSTE